jgi:putative transcriptional regulator
MNNSFPSLKDHFLIAMPELRDPHFYQSVTYIIEHDEKGAMGLVINQPMELSTDELFLHLNIDTSEDFVSSKNIMSGGPVQVERGFIIHSPIGQWDSSIEFNSNIAVTTSKDILTAIAQNEGPEEMEIILGYAGWGAGQLDEEILANSWLNVAATPEILFHTAVEQRWKAAAQLIGIDITQLSSATGHG